jgi:hypothetical protein
MISYVTFSARSDGVRINRNEKPETRNLKSESTPKLEVQMLKSERICLQGLFVTQGSDPTWSVHHIRILGRALSPADGFLVGVQAVLVPWQAIRRWRP